MNIDIEELEKRINDYLDKNSDKIIERLLEKNKEKIHRIIQNNSVYGVFNPELQNEIMEFEKYSTPPYFREDEATDAIVRFNNGILQKCKYFESDNSVVVPATGSGYVDPGQIKKIYFDENEIEEEFQNERILEYHEYYHGYGVFDENSF